MAKHERTNLRTFESPEDYAAYLLGVPRHLESESFHYSPINKGTDKLLNGDTSRLADAQAIIDKLNLEHVFSIDVPVLAPSVVGFIPNVPAAIAGHPESMFTRGYAESPAITSPLTVCVETTVSSGVTSQQLIARGTAILAFVLAMELVRPVDLYIANHHSHSKQPGVYGYKVKIASRPMDLGRAVWMLTDPYMARGLFHTTINDLSGCNRQCGIGPWSWNLQPSSAEYQRRTRELFEMQPTDVFMFGGHLRDEQMLKNPVKWVSDMIAKHATQQQEEHTL